MKGLKNIFRGLALIACYSGTQLLPITRAIGNDTYADAINQDKAIVEVTATWCVPCKAVEPEYTALARNHPGTPFYTIDLDENLRAADALNVSSVPTVILFENGQERARATGLESLDPQRIRAGLEQLVHN